MSNLGLGPTDVANWTDTIWLTTDPKRPNPSKGDVLLATLPHDGTLGNSSSVITPPQSYTVSTTVTLPEHITGQYYITAWADSFNVVLKNTLDVNVNPDDPNQLNNDNYNDTPINVLLTPPPDLVVTSVTPQTTAVGGDPFTVSWTVQNQGTSATEDAILFDQVYLSNSPTLNAPGRPPVVPGDHGARRRRGIRGQLLRSSRLSSSPRKSPANMSSWRPTRVAKLTELTFPGHGKDPTPITPTSLRRTSPPCPPPTLRSLRSRSPQAAELFRRSDQCHLDGHERRQRGLVGHKLLAGRGLFLTLSEP